MIVVKVNPALGILAPAVVLPEIEIVGAEVIINDVQDNRDAVAVSSIDHPLEALGSAIAALNRKRIRQAISPRTLTGESHRRHDLESVHTKVLKIWQPPDHLLEAARIFVRTGSECAHVKLVNDQFI